MIEYLLVAAIGGGLGSAELITRYRDRPGSLVRVPSTWVYVFLNAGAAAAALLLMHTFGWRFGAHSTHAARAGQVLAASLGSMVIFRSAVFTVRVGDEDVAIGPSTLLSSLLGAADRGVDRMRAKSRSQEAKTIMAGVSFAKSRLALPTLCLALLQNVPAEDQADLRTAIDALAGSDMSDKQKALNLGLLLMNVAGPDVVAAAVDTLRSEIEADETDPSALAPLPPMYAGPPFPGPRPPAGRAPAP